MPIVRRDSVQEYETLDLQLRERLPNNDLTILFQDEEAARLTELEIDRVACVEVLPGRQSDADIIENPHAVQAQRLEELSKEYIVLDMHAGISLLASRHKCAEILCQTLTDSDVVPDETMGSVLFFGTRFQSMNTEEAVLSWSYTRGQRLSTDEYNVRDEAWYRDPHSRGGRRYAMVYRRG